MTLVALLVGLILAGVFVAMMTGRIISRAELEDAKLAAIESHRFHFEDGPAPPARMVHYAQDLSEIDITTDITYEQVTRWLPLDVVADIEWSLKQTEWPTTSELADYWHRHTGGTP